MKRSWMGLGLLLVLLAVSLLVTWAMERIHEPISGDLEQAAVFALTGNWDNGEDSFQKARVTWEKWAHFRACFADHNPMEEIEAGFAELEAYGAAREEVAFAAAAKALARKVAAVGEAHGLVWWNVL